MTHPSFSNRDVDHRRLIGQLRSVSIPATSIPKLVVATQNIGDQLI